MHICALTVTCIVHFIGTGCYNNAVFFTREQLAVGLRFPMPTLAKQFLHFTRAALVHLNVICILIGCSVLNFLYQLDLSLVEICFAYSLMLQREGRLSFSILDSRLQFVNGLLDSPKTEVKGVTLVRRPWDETPGPPDLPFYINLSQRFLGVCRD